MLERYSSNKEKKSKCNQQHTWEWKSWNQEYLFAGYWSPLPTENKLHQIFFNTETAPVSFLLQSPGLVHGHCKELVQIYMI
jgi:hypothetical protein